MPKGNFRQSDLSPACLAFLVILYCHFRALAVFHLDVDTLDGGTRANRPAVEVVVPRLAVVMPGDARCKFIPVLLAAAGTAVAVTCWNS